MSIAVKDKIAEKLEASGFWRRAATRWLEVMNKPGNTPAQREWLRLRRIHCQRQVRMRQPPSENWGIIALSKAATATQAEMGIARPRRNTFWEMPVTKKQP